MAVDIYGKRRNVIVRGAAVALCLLGAGCTTSGSPLYQSTDTLDAPVAARPTVPMTPELIVTRPSEANETASSAPEPVRIIGSGIFARPTPAGAPRSGLPAGDVTLNFANSDIREVAKAVFEDILGANYFVDPSVTGSVTMSTVNPIARDAVLPLIESVFRTAGAAVILDVDGVYRVLKESDALALGAPVQVGRSNAIASGYTIRIVPLRHTSAEEIAKIVRPIAPQGAILHVDDARGVIVLAGGSDLLARLTQTIEIFDVDWMSGMSFAIVPTETPDVSSLVTDLEEVYSLAAGGGAKIGRAHV